MRSFEVTQYQYDALQLLKPPENITVSEWAQKYRTIDSKSAAMPGKWDNSTTPYLVGVMDEFNNYETETIIFCKPSQIGGTEAMQNIVGYITVQDPAPTMIVYPTVEIAKSVAENRLKPMLTDTQVVAERFDDKSQLLEMQFDGMYLAIVGSNSPSSLASRPIRYLMMDEVDKYPDATKKEADPLKLAKERTKTFHNKKIYITSTPTTQDGHIWKAKEEADIEKHYFVPCPHCGEYIELKWQYVDIPKEDEVISYRDRAEFAVYRCQSCKEAITDNDKHNILPLGEWRVVRQSTKYARTVAFWINTLYSPFVRWADIAREWLLSKDMPESLQNFINSWLAEPWEDTRFRMSTDSVLQRQTELPPYVVPEWAKLLTGGVDVQETSLYWTIRAWGDFLTSQNIAHGQALSFQEIDEVMNLEYKKKDGTPMIVNLCLVDSGDQTDAVYDFCVSHSDYALPVKGSSHTMLNPYRISKIKKSDSMADGMRLILVDGGAYKDMIAGRLKRQNGRGSWMVYEGCDEEYAQMITAEHKVAVKTSSGTKMVWKVKSSHGDNHYLDCEVYAMAAADIKGARTMHLESTDEVGREQEKQDEPISREEQWIQANEDWLK